MAQMPLLEASLQAILAWRAKEMFECYKQCAQTGDNTGIQLLYHLLNNDCQEEQAGLRHLVALPDVLAKVNHMLKEQQHEELHDVQSPSNDDCWQSVSLTCEKSKFEKQVIMRLPAEVRERLHTKKRLCELIGCKRAFYGVGCMRRTYYQRASRPTRARAPATEGDDEGQQTITPMTPVAAAPEVEEAATTPHITRLSERCEDRRP